MTSSLSSSTAPLASLAESSKCARLSTEFFNQSCRVLARSLLGQTLCRRLSPTCILKGKIVETEMYPGHQDHASHSFNQKRTARNGAMFMEPGTSYVYSIYGMYHCFNISSQEEGGAVLIRSLEPLGYEDHWAILKANRCSKRKLASLRVQDLTNGPSKLCLSFDINKVNGNALDLKKSDQIWVEKGDNLPEDSIFVSTRIGIGSSGEASVNKPYRFYVKNNEHVSILDSTDPFKTRKRRRKEVKE
ncbi:hypothetical protein TCAL_00870 [Tigriopus californicus]|uniref:DNA-3-methyladenine glycosylase n=1 Tax=Tigriopus californicus TaxID=6832 RepID=A0A553NBI6_TIGCA|nr:putative 3-methyladenine DNA glycosylase [Tigriopus californicus]TRY62801.1 hypothetical protein TCAL_00870 [Tigriopus californicus]|eukprot:TCALIF_00870-PA protein Name:"Similar to Mpg DNA-3-methyladenine glycosylase (Mus musculus)" AED:0.05 eAED:0.05 QI:185/1/1/1/1/1/2/102/245